LAGVCGGLGEYLNIDPVIVRLLWILLLFFNPQAGILLYAVAALLIPKKPARPEEVSVGREGASLVIALVIVLLAAVVFFLAAPWAFVGPGVLPWDGAIPMVPRPPWLILLSVAIALLIVVILTRR